MCTYVVNKLVNRRLVGGGGWREGGVLTRPALANARNLPPRHPLRPQTQSTEAGVLDEPDSGKPAAA